MNTNTPSLNDLYDIVEPAPVSWWPPAPGWWLLLTVISFATAYLLVRWLKCRRKNAYRRAARAELDKAESVSEVAAILRRTALAAYPRKTITSLHGQKWIEWLEQTLPLPDSAKDILTTVYSEDSTDMNPLRDYTRRWILQHPPMEDRRC